MTPQIEKVFFSYILSNRKKYYEIVKPFFFKNSTIQFVYEVMRNYMLTSTETKPPSNRQILDMVSLEDKEGIITKPMLKSILDVNLSEYNEVNFILPKFNGWVLSNRIKTGTVDVIEETRNLDNISDFAHAVESANKIKSIINEMSSVNFVQDEDMGSDFDEPENHVQDSSRFKVKCGFETIDHMLGGGWDISTLNVIMAQTNGGKCFSTKTLVNTRVKDTNIIKEIEIGELFNDISNQNSNS
jgi:replicative DNA helicase